MTDHPAPETRMKARRLAATGDSAIRNYPLLLRRYERIMELSRDLASTLDQNTLLRRVILAAIELTETEAASILLLDPRTGELRFEATTSLESISLEGIVVPREGSIAGWIVTHDEPLVVPDTRKDPRFFSEVDSKTAFVTRSLLGVPLRTREKTIGALEALNKRTGGFTDDDVDALETLAAQAAVAIQNARLFQQSDLIAEMVHELRTPLASLTATAHILLRHDLPEERRQDLIHTIGRETNRLSQMTTDFLDLARLESGRVRFTLQPFDVAELIRECAGIVRPQAAERGIALKTEIQSDLPHLEGDQSKIKQVLLNLLTNAVKYNCENGSITVCAHAREAMLHVTVQDTGRGISPEALPHIFEKFFRVADTEGWTQGTGLGLAIARKIVKAHGGEMNVESTVGVGTTFSFTLPFSRAAHFVTRMPTRPTRSQENEREREE